MQELAYFVAGAALSIPLSVFANILTPKLLAYFERRKIIKTKRARQQETAVFERTGAFKNGTRDRYPFYILSGAASVISAVIAATLIILGSTLELAFDTRVVTWGVATGAAAISLALLLGVHSTATHLENFPDYAHRFKERWPDGEE